MITNTNKPKKRRGKVLIINAVKEVRQDKNIGYLDEHHIQKIYGSYRGFTDQDDYARVLTLDEIAGQKFNLAINRYIRPDKHRGSEDGFSAALSAWESSSDALNQSMVELFTTLEGGRA